VHLGGGEGGQGTQGEKNACRPATGGAEILLRINSDKKGGGFRVVGKRVEKRRGTSKERGDGTDWRIPKF